VALNWYSQVWFPTGSALLTVAPSVRGAALARSRRLKGLSGGQAAIKKLGGGARNRAERRVEAIAGRIRERQDGTLRQMPKHDQVGLRRERQIYVGRNVAGRPRQIPHADFVQFALPDA
jgi:hypothetical protein